MQTEMTKRSAVQLASKQLTFARSPAGLFAILATAIFVAEVIVMLLLAALPTLPPLPTIFLDATILVVLVFPALRAFAFGPLLRQLRAREEAEEQLREANQTLERRVQERTHELQMANESLNESEARFRDLFENANDLIQCVRPDGSLLYVNRAWCVTLGYSATEIPGLSLIRDIIHPSSVPHCMEMFQQVMAGNALEHVEAVFRTKDGREIIVEGNSNCHFVKSQPAYTRSIFRDITERRRVQQEREQLIADLQQALADVKRLGGLLPICAGCKQIRDDRGYWSQVEAYIAKHSEARFTHGLCPICTKKFFPGLTPEELDPNI